MKSLPLPIRVVAGLAASAVDRATKLPEEIAGLPVTVASQALQLSMRVQQHVTELAIRGDEALAGLRRVEDKPDWVTFDEDEDDASAVATVHDFLRREAAAADRPVGTGDIASGGGAAAPSEPATTGSERTTTGETVRTPVVPRPATPPDAGTTGSDEPMESVEPEQRKHTPTRPRSAGVRRPDPAESATAPMTPPNGHPTGPPRGATGTTSADTAPGGLAGFDEMTVAQVRGRLRTLSLAQLEELLAHERAHGRRERLITMLSNRMRTVRAAED